MIDKQFIVERQGRSFVLYAGLLDLAHKEGLKAIRTRLIQTPSEDNGQTAIVSAEVETERGTFAGIGDASPANVSRAMLTVTIRLAETRAKARALRDAVNVGVAALEELGDSDVSENGTSEHRPNASTDVGKLQTSPTAISVSHIAPTPIRPPATPHVLSPPTDAKPATTAQVVCLRRLATQRGAPPERSRVDFEKLNLDQASALIREWQHTAAS